MNKKATLTDEERERLYTQFKESINSGIVGDDELIYLLFFSFFERAKKLLEYYEPNNLVLAVEYLEICVRLDSVKYLFSSKLDVEKKNG
jgi:hypothetical protein